MTDTPDFDPGSGQIRAVQSDNLASLKWPRQSPRPWLTDFAAVVLGFVLSAIHASTPILDDYLGRQIPTAMVARNLDRGAGFFHPQLDTGPFPNLFLVEPPVYAALAALLKRLSGLPIEAAGRLLSAMGMAAAGWGIVGLDRRRFWAESREPIPLLFFFPLLPVCLRFGSDFQPDVLALGLMLAGLRVWDLHETGGGVWRLGLAWFLVATALSMKILTAYALVPLVFDILKPRSIRKTVVGISSLVPAISWYIYAVWQMNASEGSRASADNAGYWLHAASFAPLFDWRTYRTVAYMLIWRAFSPAGFLLAGIYVFSWSWRVKGTRFWQLWGLSASIMLVIASGKLHHEYYFLALAPVFAIGIHRGLLLISLVSEFFAQRTSAAGSSSEENTATSQRRAPFKIQILARGAEAVAALAFVGSSLMVYSTANRVPPEWSSWRAAVRAISENTAEPDWIVAPEALVYLADRKGCRLEYEPKSRVRAAGEWSAKIDPTDPLALVELYRSKGARYVADLWPVADEPERRLLHDAIRRRYNVIVDRDGVLLAELVDRRE